MKIELISLVSQIVSQAIKNKISFREAWLIFGATLYTGYCELNKDLTLPPWSKNEILPDLSKKPHDL